MKPFRFVVASSASYDASVEAPAYASIRVDAAFVSRLNVLKQVCFVNNLESATVRQAPDWQKTGIRISGESLRVMSGSFWFEGNERYDGYDIETDVISIANFISLARAGKGGPKGGWELIESDKSYRWSSGILFYAGNDDFVADLIGKFKADAESETN